MYAEAIRTVVKEADEAQGLRERVEELEKALYEVGVLIAEAGEGTMGERGRRLYRREWVQPKFNGGNMRGYPVVEYLEHDNPPSYVVEDYEPGVWYPLDADPVRRLEDLRRKMDEVDAARTPFRGTRSTDAGEEGGGDE